MQNFQLNFDGNYLIPSGAISTGWNEFVDVFIQQPKMAKRDKIFESYLKYLNDLKLSIEGNPFIQWLDGSFVTKKTNPSDLDIVTFLPENVYFKFESKLALLTKPKVQLFYNGLIDAYILPDSASNRNAWFFEFSRIKGRNKNRFRVKEKVLLSCILRKLELIMRNDLFKSLALHIEGIQSMKQMEENNANIPSVALQYKCKKEELFQDMIFVLLKSNTDILNKLYAIVLGKKTFNINPELDLMAFLNSMLEKNTQEKENPSELKGLRDFIEKLSDVLTKFDKLKQLEKIFAASEGQKIKNRHKSSSDFEKLEAIMV